MASQAPDNIRKWFFAHVSRITPENSIFGIRRRVLLHARILEIWLALCLDTGGEQRTTAKLRCVN